jgi:ribosome biogenesis GTPase
VILTKVDLLSNEKKVEEILENYQKLGVEVIPYSQVTSLNLSLIKEKIKGKVIAFMGQTGVGKSSLINQIDPDFKRAIGEYSSLLGRGKHQTKEVILLPYGGGFIADTPGFSSLELPIFKEDLAKYFPGFNFPQTCKFTNCLHLSESTCCIKDKVKNGEISQENYQNYVDMSQELIFRKDRY